MKLIGLMFLTASLLGHSVYANDPLKQHISCTGERPDSPDPRHVISVDGNPDDNTLTIVEEPRIYELPITRVLPRINRVLPMFPIHTISARRDYRPVDGTLISAELTIQSDAVDSEAKPAKIEITFSGITGGSTVVQNYDLTCTISD